MRYIAAAIASLLLVFSLLIAVPAEASPATLKVISWNVRITQSPANVRAELREIRDGIHPQVIELSEATRMYGHLDGLGYRVIQRRPVRNYGTYQTEDANKAILVAAGVRLDRVDVMVGKECWRGPKAGIMHEPRTQLGVVVTWQGESWKLGAFHGPFGRRAVNEFVATEVRYSLRTVPGRPVIIVGDQNLSRAAFTERVAKPTGSRVAGNSVDLAAYRNVRLISVRVLAWHGSDHRPVYYFFSE